MRRTSWLLAVLLLSPGSIVQADAAESSRIFPFVLPWDDATPGVTDLSGWLTRPAGKHGPVHAGPDGHLYTGQERIRFFGVNCCFGADFPRKEDAEKIAARLARFGINIVRFHHMDMFAFPGGIRARQVPDTRDLDPEALDRLDYFIAQLKQHGIYANLNLLVSRPFNAADGLPAEIEKVDAKDRHVAGFFYPPLLELQKEYARKLLTHRNRYTELQYTEDPAVAFVEINNENGLFQGWLGNQVDRLPPVFLKELQQQWNAWLRKRYAGTDRLRQAWGAKAATAGAEMLANAGFTRSTESWDLERHEKAEAVATVSDEVPAALPKGPSPARSVRLKVTKISSLGWHIQFVQRGLRVQANRPYTLSLWARADKPLTLSANLGQAHAPWESLGLGTPVSLTTDWKQYRFVVEPTQNDDNARISISDLARQTATVWLAGISFRPGGGAGLDETAQLEKDSVPIFQHTRFAERSAEAQRDWLRFLWETEDAYWQAMQRYLKEELRVQGVVVGTIVGCSTPNLMAKFDAVDTHAYWQHPHFPGRPWDPDNWIVNNRSMVNEAGGTLPGLALRRVLGKPHCVSEYNHSAPNTYGSEGFLLLAAYAGLQDWDALYAFAYSHRGDDWNPRRIMGFFDIDQHPTKLATLVPAMALFVRGDVQPGREQVLAALSKEQEIEALRKARAWELVHAGQVSVPREASLVHRVALVAEEDKSAKNSTGKAAGKKGTAPLPQGDSPLFSGPRYASDTGELTWDLSDKGRGVVVVNTPRSKAIIGYGGGKRYDLDGVVLEPGDTLQNGWSALTLTAMSGTLARAPAHVLITATGSAENTGMIWKDPEKNSVGRNWGEAPSRVEGIPARITLPCPAARTRAWALDEHGQRKTPLPIQAGSDGHAVLTLGPDRHTLWYEVECRP